MQDPTVQSSLKRPRWTLPWMPHWQAKRQHVYLAESCPKRPAESLGGGINDRSTLPTPTDQMTPQDRQQQLRTWRPAPPSIAASPVPEARWQLGLGLQIQGQPSFWAPTHWALGYLLLVSGARGTLCQDISNSPTLSLAVSRQILKMMQWLHPAIQHTGLHYQQCAASKVC